MKAPTFWKVVTMDESDLLERLLALFDRHRIRYCVIDGQGVNAYTEPVVSLDLDIVVAADQVGTIDSILAGFKIERFAHSINVSAEGSDLRIQIQTDPRYPPFVDRATRQNILGRPLPVAAVEDVLQGKVWAASDETRRPSKRQKDLADIARLIESHPQLRARVPGELLDRLI